MITLATDFDGTIFFAKEIPSFHEEDLQAIQRFQKDNKFGLCTGRPIASILTYTDPYFQFDFMIASTGSYIVDKEGNVLWDQPIESSLAKKVVSKYVDAYTVFMHLNQTFSVYQKSLNEKIPEIVIEDVNQLDQYKTYQITIVAHSVEEARKICQEINGNYPLNAFQNQDMIDIVCDNCSKGKGIEFIKKYYQLDSIVGIGDSQNDMPMFNVSDESFTFTYSPLEVQETTTYIVDHFYNAVDQLIAKE